VTQITDRNTPVTKYGPQHPRKTKNTEQTLPLYKVQIRHTTPSKDLRDKELANLAKLDTDESTYSVKTTTLTQTNHLYGPLQKRYSKIGVQPSYSTWTTRA